MRGRQGLSAGLLLVLVAGCWIGCGDGDASVNISRIQAIGESKGGSEEDLAFVVERLKSGNAEERTSAAWALGQAGSSDATYSLVMAARDDSDLYVRINAVGSLGMLGGKGVQEVLVGLLGRGDDQLQAAVLKALGNKKYTSAYEAVGGVLAEGNDVLRPIAADTLIRMEDPATLPLLQGAAGDPDMEVRNLVAFGMGKARDPGSIPHLTPLLQDGEWEVRANAAQAMGMIGDPSARPALEALTDDPHETVQIAARRALGKLQ